MKKGLFTLLLVGLLHGNAYAAAPETAKLAIDQLHATTTAELQVHSTTFEHQQPIPEDNSSYGKSISPQLAWSKGPAGTQSYALLLEDEDGIRDDKPIVHWVAYAIPAAVTELPAGLASDATLTAPVTLLQGLTIRGTPGYVGPRPRVGDGPHRYHFQVFALDNLPTLPAGATREALLQAIDGHVLAKGKLTGTYTPAAL